MSKKINSFIALLLLAATFNGYSMEQQIKKIRWVALAGTAIIGGYAAYKQFLSYIHEEPFPFTELPFDKQHLIITLLAKKNNAASLKEAAKTINSLAQTNKQLNELINDPKFCLTLIKHLARNFGCSDQEAAKALQTQEAKRRLELQRPVILQCLRRDKDFPEILPTFESLYEQGADLEFTYDSISGQILTPLMIASSMLDTPNAINILITLGVDINRSNIYGTTALMIAVENPHTNILDALLTSKDLIINKQDLEGNTALMICCSPWHHILSTEIIKRLLDAGADPELANYEGLTPLAAAQQWGNQEIIDLMQDAINEKQNPTLIKTAQKNNCLMIKKLLDNGADINTADFNGRTALMWAVYKKHTDAVQCLLDNPNIAIDQQDNKEYTALMLAILGKNKLIIKLLLDAGADPELADSKRRTPLKVVQQIGDAEILSLINKAILKKHGVVNIVTKTQK